MKPEVWLKLLIVNISMFVILTFLEQNIIWVPKTAIDFIGLCALSNTIFLIWDSSIKW
jgi:hypothetical protein